MPVSLCRIRTIRNLRHPTTRSRTALPVVSRGFDTAACFAYTDAQGLARGAIDERNSHEGSWWTKMDLRLEQEFPAFAPGHRAAGYLVIENLGNLISDEWGILTQASYPQIRSVVDAEYDAGTNQYVFESFNPLTAESRVSSASTWQVLFGVKYDF